VTNTADQSTEDKPATTTTEPQEAKPVAANPPVQVSPTKQTAPVKHLIIAKKTALENRILSDLATKLDVTVDVADSYENLKQKAGSTPAGLIIFDKELSGLNLKEISDIIRQSPNSSAKIALMHDANHPVTPEEETLIDEAIASSMNKQTLQTLITTHIK
jgi:hypothetical protein